MKENAIEKYRTIVFDCDGVVLNSNQVKTTAFYSVAKSYSQRAAKEMVKYHLQNGGISRYKKFKYFLRQIMGKTPEENELESLLDLYAHSVWEGILKCDVAKNLKELRNLTSKCRWLLVSGGDQSELRRLFKLRNIDCYFEGGIFGSPDDKDNIIKREINIGNIKKPAVYIGDSRYDFETAEENGLDFIFVSEWSEFHEWREYFKNTECLIVRNLGQLLYFFSRPI